MHKSLRKRLSNGLSRCAPTGCRVRGVRPSMGRLWAFWGRFPWWPSRSWRVPTLVWPLGIGVGGCARVVRRGMRKS